MIEPSNTFLQVGSQFCQVGELTPTGREIRREKWRKDRLVTVNDSIEKRREESLGQKSIHYRSRILKH